MNRTVCVIPIKTHSSRLPNKNFRQLGDKPLFKWLIESVVRACCFSDIYIDSDSEIIEQYAIDMRIKFIQRLPRLAQGGAGGNDLIEYYRAVIPDYDYYFQAHVTSPFLSEATIRQCHDILVNSSEYDSILTVQDIKKFTWYQLSNRTNRYQAINYNPKILPRTQDLKSMFQETSGLYGVKADVFDEIRCRIGNKPYFFIIDNEKEAIDIDTIDDFKYAEYILRR